MSWQAAAVPACVFVLLGVAVWCCCCTVVCSLSAAAEHRFTNREVEGCKYDNPGSEGAAGQVITAVSCPGHIPRVTYVRKSHMDAGPASAGVTFLQEGSLSPLPSWRRRCWIKGNDLAIGDLELITGIVRRGCRDCEAAGVKARGTVPSVLMTVYH